MRNVHKVLVALAFSDLEHVLVGSLAEKIFRRSPATVISYRDEKVPGAASGGWENTPKLLRPARPVP